MITLKVNQPVIMFSIKTPNSIKKCNNEQLTSGQDIIMDDLYF